MSTTEGSAESAADRGAPRTLRPEAVSDERSVGELVIDVSEQTSDLIREEIELAKAEVTEKVTKLPAGLGRRRSPPVSSCSMALAMFMHGIAWLLNDLFFDDSVWAAS